METALADHNHWRQTGTVPVCTFLANGSPNGMDNALRWNPAAATMATARTIASTPMLLCAWDMKVVSQPNANMWGPRTGSSSSDGGWYFDAATAKWYPAINITTPALAGSGITLTVGQWYHIAMRWDGAVSPSLLDISVDGVAQTQASNASINSVSSISIGQSPANVTGEILFANYTESVTSADHPLPKVDCRAAWPNSDGTHTGTSTNIVKGVTATPVGAAIIAGVTNAYQWVAGPTIADTADFWNQQTASSAEYAEVNFPDAPTGVAPLAVTFHAAISAAGTGANVQSGRTIDSATELSLWSSTVGVAHPTLTWKSVTRNLNSAGGAWTKANYDAIKFRWGYSSDATPDAYLNNIVIESAFPLTYLPKSLISRQAVKRAAYY